MKSRFHLSPVVLLACLLGFGLFPYPIQAADDTSSCDQDSPADMAKAAGVELPPLPWHIANIWWQFQKPVEHFESLEIDITIDRDVPDTYNVNTQASPDCARVKADGDTVRVDVGPIFKRDESERTHSLILKP